MGVAWFRTQKFFVASFQASGYVPREKFFNIEESVHLELVEVVHIPAARSNFDPTLMILGSFMNFFKCSLGTPSLKKIKRVLHFPANVKTQNAVGAEM